MTHGLLTILVAGVLGMSQPHKYLEVLTGMTITAIESANMTTVKTAAIVSSAGSIWALVNSAGNRMQTAKDRVVDATTVNVTEIVHANHLTNQENSTGGRWVYENNNWVSSSNRPTTPVPVAPTPTPVALTPAPVMSPPTSTRQFNVSNGKIIAPDGTNFIARGINIADYDIGSRLNNGKDILTLFPKINMVRLNCETIRSDTPAALKSFITTLTSAKVVVELEDHLGKNPTVSGSRETTQLAWYTAIATAYKNNPYVWFGTTNEPSSTAGAVANQVNIYNSIRDTGNAHPIMLEINFTGSLNVPIVGFQKAYQTSYSPMTNVVWDVHTYGWLYGGKAVLVSQATANACVAAQIAYAQSITSADGVVPVIIGEYGTSTNGTTIDMSGTENVTAVQFSGVGSLAWTYGAGVLDKLLASQTRLTSYGKEVAQFIAGNPPSTWKDTDNS